MRTTCLWLLLALGLPCCSSRPVQPNGPAPEYERPKVLAWDAGAAQDLPDLDEALDEAAEGEWVDDEPEAQPDAGAAASDASAAPPIEGGAGEPADAAADGNAQREGGKPGEGSGRGV